MKLYINTSTDPYFNLATEEYLLKNAKDDVIMLWRNAPSVIIGKNQNAYAEINFDFVKEHGIKVVRRMTGGGAVFHDLGNLNYTFISPSGGRLASGIREGGLDFAHFTRPILSALRGLGLDASLSGRNDIVVSTEDGERKVSGNAQCVIDGTTLHHGTLLFSAELERLSGALNPDPDKLKSKGIASVRSRVANIRDLMTSDATKRFPDVNAFADYLTELLKGEFSTVPECLSAEDTAAAENLAQTKYALDEWNLRRFGSFSAERRRRFDYGRVEARFEVESGIMTRIEFGGDFFGTEDVEVLSRLLTGVEYSREAIMVKLYGFDVSGVISGASASDITNLLFTDESVL